MSAELGYHSSNYAEKLLTQSEDFLHICRVQCCQRSMTLRSGNLAIMDTDKMSRQRLGASGGPLIAELDDHSGRRRERRQRTFKEAQIVFNAGQSVINCIIRDRSPSGARLKVDLATRLPDSFDLLISSELRLYPVEVRWCRGDLLGVEIVGPSRPLYKT